MRDKTAYSVSQVTQINCKETVNYCRATIYENFRRKFFFQVFAIFVDWFIALKKIIELEVSE